jgi:hypothetical protein
MYICAVCSTYLCHCELIHPQGVLRVFHTSSDSVFYCTYHEYSLHSRIEPLNESARLFHTCNGKEVPKFCHVDEQIKIASLLQFSRALSGFLSITNYYRVEFIYMIDLMLKSSVIKNPPNEVWRVPYDKHACLGSTSHLRSLMMHFKYCIHETFCIEIA